MDVQLLRAFLAVAATESFSLAAERLHLTQPAISKRIATLESHLHVRLFDRIGRHVSLTESGRQLLPRAQRIVREVADAERAIRDLSGAVNGPLLIATSHHVGLHRLPVVLRAFRSLYPSVQLSIEFMDSEKAHDAVAQGSFELAVITLAPQESTSRLESHTVWPDPLSVMVARDHPLAGRTRTTVAELARLPAVLPSAGTYTRQILQRLFDASGEQFAIAMSTNYLETLRMLATIGLGWTVLPDSMRTDELVALQLPGVQLERSLGYVVHRERTLSNAARAFIETLRQ